MVRFWLAARLNRFMIPGGALLVLGGCGLSDQQLTGILESLVSTGLNTLITQGLTALVESLAGGSSGGISF